MTLVAPRIVNDVSYVMRIISYLCHACAAVGCALPGCFRMIGRTSLLCNHVGCALSSSHPTAQALFVSLAVRAPLWAAHCRDCSPCTETFVALQCARCCGLRVVFVASDRPSILFPLRRARRCGLRVVFIASDNPSISFALPCCIRLPKTFVALQCMIFFL